MITLPQLFLLREMLCEYDDDVLMDKLTMAYCGDRNFAISWTKAGADDLYELFEDQLENYYGGVL